MIEKSKSGWKWIAIISITLLIITLLYRSCTDKKEPGEVVKIETVYDTISHPTISFSRPTADSSKIEKPQSVIDTQAVIEDYFSRKFYTLNYEDTTVKIETKLQVLNNALDTLSMNVSTVHKNTTITKIRDPTFGFSLGGAISYSIPNSKFGLEVMGVVEIKRARVLVGYDLINNAPTLGLQWQLFRK